MGKGGVPQRAALKEKDATLIATDLAAAAGRHALE